MSKFCAHISTETGNQESSEPKNTVSEAFLWAADRGSKLGGRYTIRVREVDK